MKNQIINNVIAIILITTYSSCNKDGNEAVNPIVGTWKASHITLSGCDDPLLNSNEVVDCTSTDCSKFTFKADGTFVGEQIEAGDITTTNGTYTIANGKIAFCETPSTCEDPIEYSISGSTLTLIYPNVIFGCSISIALNK